jgi:uroporphyrinogen decarboxylase
VSGLFRRALAGEVLATPPIWMMRQAGRYHQPYQRLRRIHSFEALCRTPELAAEVAMGPIVDFDFDAAIVFSDLLFPLEVVGFPVSYDDSGPKIQGRLTRTTPGVDTACQHRVSTPGVEALSFQWEAVSLTRKMLPPDKGMIGFVGGPWTLFVYAVCGSHTGSLTAATSALDLYRAFADRMTPVIEALTASQLEAGADVVMIFDTAAGALSPDQFRQAIVPDLARLASAFPQRVGYYAKSITPAHFDATFSALAWAGVGFDHHWSLPQVLRDRPTPGFVQGNFDQEMLKRPTAEFSTALDAFLAPLAALTPEERRGWICGLGHGVLPATPEEHVRQFVRTVRETIR